MTAPPVSRPAATPVREVAYQEPPAPSYREPAPEPAVAEEPEEVPFYRKVLAHNQGTADDPHGYGPNWSNVDDYDIPTVLRKQMD